TILIVGWQAPNTLGRRLVEKQPRVRILGEEYNLRAQVVTINGFSAHAGRSELLAWTDHINRRPAHAFVVHGELDSSVALADGMRSQGYPDVHVPELGQRFEL
ncbi:MAG: MBL fold metallo-hydrolase RNA specificity domain-containing protein, partial [Candidatus Promineifilaceae bacterium]